MWTRAAVRAFSTEALKVVNNVAKQEFVVELKGHHAVLDYEIKGNTITFCNTEVPPQFQGKGVGKILAKAAFDHADIKKLDVVCQCSFLKKYYENNKSKYPNLNITMQIQ